MEEKMSELKIAVQTAMDREYLRASEKWGSANNSDHESYAVIKEEQEGAEAERYEFINAFDKFWANCKIGGSEVDDAKIQQLSAACNSAMREACELIQTGAMCMKAIVTIQRRKEKCELCDLYWYGAGGFSCHVGLINGGKGCNGFVPREKSEGANG